MHLINTKSLELESFSASKVPRYAILSHTWQDEEVTYEDMMREKLVFQKFKRKKGWQKIVGASKKAQEIRLDYLWVDTCCIDKGSSAELSEAINSMFRWYQSAKVCFAYLSDVKCKQILEKKDFKEFSASRWFTRGWTLQELIAPQTIDFFGQDWQLLGSKSTLGSRISDITGIEAEVLSDPTLLYQTSIAQRMSWAANRQTERQEDIAYCLMGIFDVNMPLIYGEGMKAFIRLQEEILKVCEDHSIFAWFAEHDVPISEELLDTATRDRGVLALHPAFFRGSAKFVPYRSPHTEISSTPRGIRLSAIVTGDLQDKPLLALYCFSLNRPGDVVCVRLTKDSYMYRRHSPQCLEFVKHRDFPQSEAQNVLLHRSGRGVEIDREFLGSISIGRQAENLEPMAACILTKASHIRSETTSREVLYRDIAKDCAAPYVLWNPKTRTSLLPEPDALRYVWMTIKDRTTDLYIFVLLRLFAGGPAVVTHRNIETQSLIQMMKASLYELPAMILADFGREDVEGSLNGIGIDFAISQPRLHESLRQLQINGENNIGRTCLQVKITRSVLMGRTAWIIDLDRISELNPAVSELSADAAMTDSDILKYQRRTIGTQQFLIKPRLSAPPNPLIPHGHLLCTCCFGNSESFRSVAHDAADQRDKVKDYETMEIIYSSVCERRSRF